MQEPENVEYQTLDPNTHYIKIHGLQRTGTNYLAHLINENFQNTKVLVNLGGWKHGHYQAPWAIGEEVDVLVIAKHPYSWLVSMFNYWGPDKKLRIGMDLRGVSFDQFVRNRVIFEMQRDIPYLFRSKNPIQHWNDMYFHWMSIRLNTHKIYFVTYETLLTNSVELLENIGKTFGLTPQTKTFQNFDSTFTPAGESLRPNEERFTRRDFYLKHEYLKHYTPELLDFVNQELDLEVLGQYDYYLLSPSEL